jgi:hypothetical protein
MGVEGSTPPASGPAVHGTESKPVEAAVVKKREVASGIANLSSGGITGTGPIGGGIQSKPKFEIAPKRTSYGDGPNIKPHLMPEGTHLAVSTDVGIIWGVTPYKDK